MATAISKAAETEALVRAADDELMSLEGFRLTPTGLVPDGEPTVEHWEHAGHRLCRTMTSVQWALGDWVVFGETAIGGRSYARAIDATGYDTQTLMNFRWVATRVEISRRREGLTWSHHEVVASLEPEEQDRLLQEAIEKKWSVRQLRDAKAAYEEAPDCPEAITDLRPGHRPRMARQSVKVHVPNLTEAEKEIVRLGLTLAKTQADNAGVDISQLAAKLGVELELTQDDDDDDEPEAHLDSHDDDEDEWIGDHHELARPSL